VKAVDTEKAALWDRVEADVNEILKLEEMLGVLIARREKSVHEAFTRLATEFAPAPRFEPYTRGETILNRLIGSGGN
jgi:hypothetical protein